MYSGNPKRPNDVTYYNHPKPEESRDFSQFLSMIFAVLCFIFRKKWITWIAFFFLLSSYVNLRYCHSQKNLFVTFSLIMLGFFGSYTLPKRPDPRPINKKRRKKIEI